MLFNEYFDTKIGWKKEELIHHAGSTIVGGISAAICGGAFACPVLAIPYAVIGIINAVDTVQCISEIKELKDDQKKYDGIEIN